jgi:retinoblastoma-like protein 1
VEGKVWDLMADILVNEHKNKLIFTRHIDQIILCAIYTICRTFNLEVGFKELVGSYRKQPQVGVLADAITRNIPIANGKRGDIIDFNNTVFVPVVKNKIYPIIQVRYNVC